MTDDDAKTMADRIVAAVTLLYSNVIAPLGKHTTASLRFSYRVGKRLLRAAATAGRAVGGLLPDRARNGASNGVAFFIKGLLGTIALAGLTMATAVAFFVAMDRLPRGSSDDGDDDTDADDAGDDAGDDDDEGPRTVPVDDAERIRERMSGSSPPRSSDRAGPRRPTDDEHDD